MSAETADYIVAQLWAKGVAVDAQFVWTTEAKQMCPEWKAIDKHLKGTYSDATKGRHSALSPAHRIWLRDFAFANPKVKAADTRVALQRQSGVTLDPSSITRILHEMGASRKNIEYIAAQRNTDANVAYARKFNAKLRSGDYHKVAFFDESGITPRGMAHRRNDGWAAKGSDGAYISRTLQHWPPNYCVTVMGILDQDGIFMQDVHRDGTDWVLLEPYFRAAAPIMHQRNIDLFVLDNCPSHKVELIKGIMVNAFCVFFVLFFLFLTCFIFVFFSVATEYLSCVYPGIGPNGTQ